MLKIGWASAGGQDIAERVAFAVDRVMAAAQKDASAEAPLRHRVETLELPLSLVTDEEQRAAGNGGYLPTERAIAGKGYGAESIESRVGPEGGRVLVERTVARINEMWA